MSSDPLFDDIDFTPPDLPTVEDRRLFNSQAPISTLDDDVLSRIFMLNTSLDIEHMHQPSKTTRRTSQVFHKWRQFALGFPMMWAASLDFGDRLPWIEEVISRAGSALLNIVVPPIPRWKDWGLELHEYEPRPILTLLAYPSGIDADIADRVFKLALPLINRSRSLAIKPTNSQWQTLMPVLQQPLSDLQSFSLVPGFPGDEGLALPGTLFGGHAPQLRTLHLRDCLWQFEPISFGNLTSLSVRNLFLDNMASREPGILTAVAWLQILEGMPKLESLELSYCFREATDKVSGGLPIPAVGLPHLELMKLAGTPSSCSVVLAHLDFPSDCNIDIRCCDVVVNDHFHSMISTLTRILRSMDPVSRTKNASLSVYPREVTFKNDHYCPSRRNILLCWSGENVMDFAGSLTSFVSLLQLAGSEVNDLFLYLIHSHDPIVAGRLLVDVLLSFPKVETLRMTLPATFSRFLPVLGTRNTHPKTGDQIILFPSLTKISFLSTHFRSDDAFGFSMEDVLNFLRRRSEMGVPIGTAKFRRCRGVEKSIGMMEQLGVVVDWDEPDELTFALDMPRMKNVEEFRFFVLEEGPRPVVDSSQFKPQPVGRRCGPDAKSAETMFTHPSVQEVIRCYVERNKLVDIEYLEDLVVVSDNLVVRTRRSALQLAELSIGRPSEGTIFQEACLSVRTDTCAEFFEFNPIIDGPGGLFVPLLPFIDYRWHDLV
ncbi:hypothetical protein BDZ97DRAFT_1760011 [Flammula alnicola]|nr:hypothetical protein BDZ97DRAFT_1760011 [Flammula alnicola]